MIVWDVADLAERTFRRVPLPSRGHALQVESTRRGLKPAFMTVSSLAGAAPTIAYLRECGLACAAQELVPQPRAYSQFGPNERERLTASVRVRICAARTAFDARRIAALDASSQFGELGSALGYPPCCIDYALGYDRQSTIKEGPAARLNLRLAAMVASPNLDYRCNTWLEESNLSSAPVSLVAHYPCSFACPETIAYGEEVHLVCANVWPEWHATLGELLRSPLLSWAGPDWDAAFWDDSCGLMFIGGIVNGGERLTSIMSRFPGVPLGRALTPAGPVPSDVRGVNVSATQVVFERENGEVTTMFREDLGPTLLLEWRSETVWSF